MSKSIRTWCAGVTFDGGTLPDVEVDSDMIEVVAAKNKLMEFPEKSLALYVGILRNDGAGSQIMRACGDLRRRSSIMTSSK
jgi:hypothetical protein